MSINLNRAELANVKSNKEYVVITAYRGYEIDPCYCDLAKHSHPDVTGYRPDGSYYRFIGWRGYKRPRRKHYRMWCKRSDAAHDSWKLHRRTQYREVSLGNGKE